MATLQEQFDRLKEIRRSGQRIVWFYDCKNMTFKGE
jgi:hypothetical protein